MRRYTVYALGLLLAFVGIFALTWPTWLESYAKKKMVAALEAKFELVLVGDDGFQLTRNQLVVKDLTLHTDKKEVVTVSIETLTVDFTPDFFAQKVVVHSVAIKEGYTHGSPEGYKALRGSRKGSKTTASKLDLSNTSVDVQGFGLELLSQGQTVRGQVSLKSSSIQGPFEVDFTYVTFATAEDGYRADAASIKTTLTPKKLFPLELTVEGGNSTIKGVRIQDVEGTVSIQDAGVKEIAFNLQGKTGEGQSWSFNGDIDRSTNSAHGHFKAVDLKPSQFPVGGLPLDPEYGSLSVDLRVAREGDELFAQGSASLKDLHIFHKNLARDSIVFGGEFTIIDLVANTATRELRIEDLSFSPRVGKLLVGITVDAKGRVLYTKDPGEREYELTANMGPTPCQTVLDAMPKGLLPGLQGFELGGKTTLDLELVVEMADHKATVLKGGLDPRKCTIKKAPSAVEMLRDPFMHLVQMKNGQVHQRPLMPGHPFYVGYDELPGYVGAAVLSTEDGAFWKHKGYRLAAFKESLQRNVQVGAIRRGASTLTMQMVKNTLLTHERTLSRKIQEVFLTWVVEQTLSKKRILEIYLNVVEYGPNIYGVGHAADHYFGKDPTELTSLEAAFLATLLPRPIERHEMWCRGHLTPKHDKYIRKVHARMLRKSGHLTQEEYDSAEAAGITFSRNGWDGEKACLAEGRQMKKGGFLQEALSGLIPDR